MLYFVKCVKSVMIYRIIFISFYILSIETLLACNCSKRVQNGESLPFQCEEGRRWFFMSTDTHLTLKGVWGEANGENIWAVGQNGLILVFDGSTWRIDDVLEGGKLDVLDSIDGEAKARPVVVGWEVEFNDSTDAEGNPGGSKTRVYELKKNQWVRIDPGFAGKPRHVLSSRKGLYVLGAYFDEATLWKRTNNEWFEQRAPFQEVRDAAELNDGRIVFIMEDDGFNYLVDEQWEIITHVSGDVRLNEIIAHSNDSVTAVGRSANGKGLILHGQVPRSIKQYEVGSSQLRGVAAFSESDIYAVGNNGVIAHFNGRDWSLMDSGTSDDLWGVWVSKSSGDVISVGANGTILQYTCPNRVKESSSSVNQEDPACTSFPFVKTASSELYGVWGNDADNILVAGTRGISKVINKQANLIWTRSNVRFFDMEGTADFSYAAGFDGTDNRVLILKCTLEQCEEQPVVLPGTLHSVWVGNNGDVMAAGIKPEGQSLLLLYQINSGEWKNLESIGQVLIEDFWGQSATDLWAAGTDWGGEKPIGVVYYFDGRTWERQYEERGIMFRAVGGSTKQLASGGSYYAPDETGRLGQLVVRYEEVWRDSGLDKTYGVSSLYGDQNALLAGFVQVLMPTIEYSRGLIDLTDMASPRVICTTKESDESIEDIARLGDSTIVAVGNKGNVFFIPIVR